MSLKDEFNEVNPKRSISPVSFSSNTALVGQIIDNKGYGALTYVIAVGTAGTAGATYTVTLDEGNASDLSDASAVAATDLIGTLALASFTGNDADKTRKLGYKGSKRYTRLTITPAGNSAAAVVGVVALQDEADIQPAANPPV